MAQVNADLAWAERLSRTMSAAMNCRMRIGMPNARLVVTVQNPRGGRYVRYILDHGLMSRVKSGGALRSEPTAPLPALRATLSRERERGQLV